MAEINEADLFAGISEDSLFSGIEAPAETTGASEVQALERMDLTTKKPKGPSMAERINEERVKAMKGENPVLSSLFPRRMEGIAKEDSDATQAMGQATGDTFSMVGRVIGAVKDFKGDSWEEKFSNYLESVGKVDGDGVVQQIIRHPATGAALMLAPVVAPLMTTTTATGTTLLSPTALIGEGAGIALVNQLNEIGKGENADPVEIGIDMFSGGLVPGALTATRPLRQGAKSGIQKGMQKTADKIMESVIKPGKPLTQGRGTKFDVKNIFEFGLDSKLGFGRMEKNIKSKMSEINKEYGKALEGIPSKNRIDMQDALNKAKKDLSEEIASGKHGNDYKGVDAGLKYWQEYIDTKGLSEVPVKNALAMRKGIGEMANYNAMTSKELKGTEKAAKKFREYVNKQLDIYPKIRKLDATKSTLIPVEQAINDAAPRIRKSFIQSLNDNPAIMAILLGASGAGGFAGAQAGGFAGGAGGTVLPGLAALALSKAQKNTGVASMISRTANAPMPQGLAGIMENQFLQRSIPRAANSPFRNNAGEQ